MKISIAELKRLIYTTLRKKFTEKDARAITELVLFAEISGKKAHGVARMFMGRAAQFEVTPLRKPRIRKLSQNASAIDGFGNAGPLLGTMALREVIKIGKQKGIAVLSITGTASSTGSLSYYVHEMARYGLFALAFAQTIPLVAVHGGIKPVLGTNPIAIGIPKKPEPFVLDIATSETSGGAVFAAKEKGHKLRSGVAIDSKGRATTDASAALNGAMLTFGDHYKSSGLAIAVEMIAGLLTSTGFGESRGRRSTGSVFIAINPRFFGGNKRNERLNALYKKIQESGSREGMRPRIPGQSSVSIRKATMQRGSVDIDPDLLNKLRSAATK
jgi:LDH2 family malate/lactate/ureidoglycolate dehydrogenase